MVHGISHGDHETRVGENSTEVLDSGDVVVLFGEIPSSGAKQEYLLDVVAKERLELFVAGLRREPVDGGGRMHVGKEELANRLLKGFRAFHRYPDSIFVRSLDRLLVSRKPVDEPVPEHGGHQKRKVPVAMGGHARKARQLLEQDRGSGSRKPRKKDRRL